MSDATSIRLMDLGLRIVQASLILLAPKLWPWLPGRVPERGSTFFGVRVPPDFAWSDAGRNILRTFRRRLWICIFALASVYAGAVPEGAAVQGLWLFGALMASWLISWVLYGVARLRTRIEVGATSEPSVRTATLLPEGKPQSHGMAFAGWIAMTAPLGVPIITAILLAMNWSRYPARFHPERVPLQIVMAASFGLLMTATLFGLRYRARASDWASTPGASLRYRTYLGLQMGVASLAPILGLCALTLGPLFGGFLEGIWFGVNFLVLFVLIGLIHRIKSKLVKVFDPQSGDPMADHCWKWTCFYYNPNDPAWVVPTRSGITCSLNHARPILWAVYLLATAGTLLSLVQVAQRVP